ncbi:MAG: pyridoxal-dependent decarboxylase [Gammaproteobacteria bacterium]|nr:pyridoxal-dependent decarboxylase [Gammaproteobacteria bacterium]
MSMLRADKPNEPAFPSKGASAEDVLQRIDEFKQETPSRTYGKFSLHAMEGSDAIQDVGEQAYRKFIRFNTVFSFMLEGLGRIEDDLHDMCVEMLNGGEQGRANITSGGSESIYCALHAMREWARATRPHITTPEVVVPYSAHISFSRGAHFLDIKLIRVPVAKDYRADVGAMERAIGPNTIGLAASAPSWSYDLFDPISEVAALAQQHDLWCHVDACVGGFLAPFVCKAGYPIPDYDFTVPGVLSISADLHKYGYSPKPCSAVIWRSEEQQKYHYCAGTDWPTGPYVTQSLLGSGPAGATVAAWAVLNHLGEEGYTAIARGIMETKQKLIDGIADIDGVSTWTSDTSILLIDSDEFEIDKLVGGMQALGWVLFGNHEPPLIHLTVETASDEVVQLFLSDLTKVTNTLRAGQDIESGALAYSSDGAEGGERAPRWAKRAWALIESR